MAETVATYLVTCPACSTSNRVSAEQEGKRGRCGSCHSLLPPLHLHPIPLSDRSFDAFVATVPGPLAAEFWAPW